MRPTYLVRRWEYEAWKRMMAERMAEIRESNAIKADAERQAGER